MPQTWRRRSTSYPMDISDQARPDADYGLAVVYENVDSIVHGNSDVEKLDRFANLTKEQYK